MIDGLKPYNAYRASGLQWLPRLPEHWDIRRAKYLLSPIDVRSKSGAEELLTVSSERGIVPRRMATVTMFQAESYVGHKLCWPGDLVINSLWAWARGLGVSRYHGIVSSAYGVYRSRSEARLVPGYLHELVRSAPFHWELRVRSKGVWTSRLQLTDEFFLACGLPVPPPDEQADIVRFLEHADRRIRRYIRAKQELVKLLEEQKQAIIHRAVTRGFDPAVRLKPSRVEWLGSVPEHWDVIRLKQAITPIEQGWSPQCNSQPARDSEWGVLKVGCVNRDSFDAGQNKKLPLSLEPIAALEIRDGDILVSRANTRELLGLAALAVRPRSRLILCDKLFRFRALPGRANPQFLVHAIRGRTSRPQIESSTNGASDSMQNIGQGVIKNLYVALPPVEEQNAIVEALAVRTAALRVAIDAAHHELVLLREYRTRLIADVVTGRLDVRAASSTLPEELDDADTIAHLGTYDVDDEASDDELGAELEGVEA